MVTKKQIAHAGLDFTEVMLIATGVFLAVYFFVAQLLKVNGDSMLPTFTDGEQILAEKVSVKFKPLARGEIVIFKHPKQPEVLLIKRVVGLPKETLKISQGKVYIDGKLLIESYLLQDVITIEETTIKNDVDYIIPANSYVVMGDNRSKSADSREWGPISEENIVGRVMLIYYPLKDFRFING